MRPQKFEKVAFVGKASVGKTTAAKYLVLSKNLCKVSFADEIRYEAIKCYGLDPYLIFEDYAYKTEHRNELIQIGQQRRAEDPYYWIKKASSRIFDVYKAGLHDGVVIDDLGFINEGIWAWGLGFTLARIERPGTSDIKENKRDFEFHDWLTNNNGKYDVILHNSGTIADFCSHLSAVFSGTPKKMAALDSDWGHK